MISSSIEHISKLLDSDSFQEFKSEKVTGYITGIGKISGRKVYLTAIDSQNIPEDVFVGFQHHLELLEMVQNEPAPLIMILDQPGHHKSTDTSPIPQNPVKLLAHKRGIGYWYFMHAKLSGVVPQIAIVYGKMGAALTFPITLCDMIVMTEDSGMSIGRPDVVENILHEKVDYEKLGGAKMHASISGSVDKVLINDDEISKYVRAYLSYFPSKSGQKLPEGLPRKKNQAMMKELIPENPNTPFDMLKVVERLSDTGNLLELREGYAGEIITALVKIEGKIAGIIANNSKYKGGVFFPESCQKATRFISLCDSFGIPLVFLSDSAGFMVGSQVEQKGIIKQASMMFSTIANTSVVRMSVALRRAYTAGLYAMSGAGMNPDLFVALPSAVISIYGKNVVDKLINKSKDNTEFQHMQEMMNAASDPANLLEQGLIDEIIQPEELRNRISKFLSDNQDGSRASGRPLIID